MTIKLQTYTKYKSSGIDWLGDIPAEWTLLKNRSVVSRRRGEFNKSDDTPVLTLRIRGVRVKTDLSFGKSTDSYVGHQLVYPGDLVFTPRDFDQTPILSGVADNFGCISNLYFVLKTKPEVDGKFLNYYWWGLKYGVDYFKNFSSGMRFSFNYFQFNEIPFLKPPRETQKQIADFLDEKTKIIDELVAKKEKLIELLREKRTALITRAVTKGLNSNTKLKPSGIDWLGDIPEGWQVRRLRFLAKGAFEYGANEEAVDSNLSNPRYIRITDITESGKLNEDTFRSLSEEIARPYLLQEGDILFARSGATVGKTFLYKGSWGRCCFAGYLIRMRPDQKKVLSEFLYYFTQSNSYLDWKNSIFWQATIQNISAEKYKNFIIALPKLDQQKQIIDFLNAETGKIDKAVKLIESQIDKLKEYRSSLIYHAVTGKIKV